MTLLLAPQRPPTRLAPAADLGQLDRNTILDVIKGGTANDVSVRDMVIDITIERTMAGASTVTFVLHDPDRRLMTSPSLATAVQILFDGYGFRLFSKKKQGPTLTLVFEDHVISWLRSKKAVVTASRNDMTRVQYCIRLCRILKRGISVYAPEASRKIRVENFERSDEVRLAGRESGVDPDFDGTVKGAKATRQQKRNIQAVLDVCAELNCTRRQMIMTIQCIIGEDLARNSAMKTATKRGIDGQPVIIPLNDGSVGLFQQIRRMGWPASRDIKKDTTAFLKGASTNIGLIEASEDADEDTPNWEIIATVQRPLASLRQSTYDPWEEEATKWVEAYNPGERGGDRTFAGRYTFSTKNDQGEVEDFWTTIKRLMDEVQWAAFAQQNRLWLVREAYLTTRTPVMSVDPDTLGIEDIDFDWNVNKEDASATITCTASRWKAPAGTSVKLKGLGFDDTRWLVETIGRSAFDPLTTIELRTAQHSLPEPAPKLISVSAGDRGREVTGSDVNGLPEAIAAAYREAQKIHDKRYQYSWGGGHPKAGTPSKGYETSRGTGRYGIGYDCSGATAALLAAAKPHVEGSMGFGLPSKGDIVPASGDFGNYGVFGEGKYMTWWYNSQHVFVEFKRPGNRDSDGKRKVEHFGTGRWGKDWGGAGFNSELHPHSGFYPAHIPNM